MGQVLSLDLISTLVNHVDLEGEEGDPEDADGKSY